MKKTQDVEVSEYTLKRLKELKAKRYSGEKLTKDELNFLLSNTYSIRVEKIKNAWIPLEAWFQICENVCVDVFGYTLSNIIAKDRRWNFVYYRHIISNVAFEAGYSLSSIGQKMGGRKHDTIHHSKEIALDLHETCPIFRQLFNRFVKIMYDSGANIAKDTLFLAGITPDDEPEQNTEVCEQGRSELVSC